MTLKRTKPMNRGAGFTRKPPKQRAPAESTGVLRVVAADRKRPARKMKHGKIAPTAVESRWMAAVAAEGCIVCRRQGRGFVPCAVHHIVEGNRRVGHMHTIGLCDPGHHQNSPDREQISRHPNKARFEAAYGTEYELLAETQQIINGEGKGTAIPEPSDQNNTD